MRPATSILAVLVALVGGYTIRSAQYAPLTVHAQSHGSQSHAQTDDSLAFELSGIGPNSALTVYNAAEHTLYVYPAVTQGNSHVACSFMLHINRPGASVERQNCAPGTTP